MECAGMEDWGIILDLGVEGGEVCKVCAAGRLGGRGAEEEEAEGVGCGSWVMGCGYGHTQS